MNSASLLQHLQFSRSLDKNLRISTTTTQNPIKTPPDDYQDSMYMDQLYSSPMPFFNPLYGSLNLVVHNYTDSFTTAPNPHGFNKKLSDLGMAKQRTTTLSSTELTDSPSVFKRS